MASLRIISAISIFLDYSYRITYNLFGVIYLERRIAKVNIGAAGGTAVKGAKTCKVTLPNSWLDEMGVGAGRREVELAFDGNQIVISRYLAGAEFVAHKLEQGHDVRRLRYYDRDVLCTTIYADFSDKTLTAENHVGDPVKTAFGNNALPGWDDMLKFLEDRCIPRGRDGLREYLETIGVSDYDPLEIISKTAGRMAEDNQWMEMEAIK